MKKLAYIVLSAVIVSVLGFTTISQAKKTAKSTTEINKASATEAMSASTPTGKELATWD